MQNSWGVLISLFARLRSPRIAAILLAFVVMSVLGATAALQASQQSGAQVADQIVGRSEGVVQVAGYSTLGAAGNAVAEDQSVQRVLQSAGVDVTRVGWLAAGIRVDLRSNLTATLEQDDWASRPFPNRLKLLKGRWASGPTEVTVSRDLLRTYPVGSQLRLAGGLFSSRVVGVALDVYARTTPTLFLGPGTWEKAQQQSAGEDRNLEWTASRTFFYEGSVDANSLADTATTALRRMQNQQAVAFSRGELTTTGAPNYVELVLLSILGPLVGGFLAGVVATRSLSRTRSMLWTIGISKRSSRFPFIVACASVEGIGVTVGLGAGVLIAKLVPMVFDTWLDVEPGRGGTLIPSILLLIIFSLGGITAASCLFQHKYESTQGVSYTKARRGRPSRSFATFVTACFFAVGGMVTTQGSRDPNSLLLGATLFGVVLVVCAPSILTALLKVDPRSVRLRLVFRRLRLDKTFGTALIASAVLLLVALSSMTFINSSIAATNASNRSTVLPGQVQLRASGMPEGDPDETAQRFSEQLELSPPLLVWDVTNLVADLDGSVLAVNSPSAAERFLGHALTRSEREDLLGGAVLRPEIDGVVERSFLVGKKSLALRSVPIANAGDATKAWGGIVLQSGLQGHGATTSVPIYVWTEVPVRKMQSAREVALRIGVRASAVGVYRVPDVFGIPVGALIIGVGTLLVNGLILMGNSAADIRRLRPTLSGLYSLGASQKWLRSVVLLRSGIAGLAAVAVAVIAAVVGVGIAIAVSGLSFSLALPLPLLACTACAVVGASVLVAMLSSRSLSNMEWQ